MDVELQERLERAIRADGRYSPEAYEFLYRGLEFTGQRKHGQRTKKSRHVTGQELAEGLRDLAIRQWGPLAREVLRRWNIHRTRDFGEMVYFLIDQGAMSRQDSDDITDFDDVYDFRDAFEEYRIGLGTCREDGEA